MYNHVVRNSYCRQNQKGINFLRIFISVVVILGIIMIFYVFTTFGSESLEYNEIKVRSGDSLWSIAERYGNNEIDLRKLVYQIKRINNLENAILQPGQTIKLPIK